MKYVGNDEGRRAAVVAVGGVERQAAIRQPPSAGQGEIIDVQRSGEIHCVTLDENAVAVAAQVGGHALALDQILELELALDKKLVIRGIVLHRHARGVYAQPRHRKADFGQGGRRQLQSLIGDQHRGLKACTQNGNRSLDLDFRRRRTRAGGHKRQTRDLDRQTGNLLAVARLVVAHRAGRRARFARLSQGNFEAAGQQGQAQAADVRRKRAVDRDRRVVEGDRPVDRKQRLKGLAVGRRETNSNRSLGNIAGTIGTETAGQFQSSEFDRVPAPRAGHAGSRGDGGS